MRKLRLILWSLLLASACAISGCGKKESPKPQQPATIDEDVLLGNVWITTLVVATKPDGSTVTITDKFSVLFLPQPQFDSLPTASADGSGNDHLIGERFYWQYDASTHVLTVPFSPDQIVVAKITHLDAHKLVLHHEGRTPDYGDTYTKFDQTLER